LNQVEPDV